MRAGRDQAKPRRYARIRNEPAYLPSNGKPLATALGALARAFTSETGIRTLRVLGQGALPVPTEIELFRIVQESFANVRRHAHASTVAIALRTDAHIIRLVIHDNGRGGASTTSTKGQGVRGMQERAGLLGGHCRCFSRPGKGTTVAVIVPVLKRNAP